MASFASALSEHPIAAQAVGEITGSILEQLDDAAPNLVVCFASPHFAGAFEDVAGAVRAVLAPDCLIGATVVSVIGGGREVEDAPAVSVFAASLPDAVLTAAALRVEDSPDGPAIVGWPEVGGSPSAMLALADPFSFPADLFLAGLALDQPHLQVIGGFASAGSRPGQNRLAIDDEILDSGAVGVFLDGVDLKVVVSQGCRPIGRPFVVTRSERNFVEELAGEPPLERLQAIAATASEEDRDLLRTGLHLGVVVDEHRSEFGRGDFLVRNVLGADPASGALAIGEQIEVGQTVQFQVRDAVAADEDLRILLADTTAAGALVFTCNGRGERLFGIPDHDAGVVQELLGPIPAAGGFCAGEIGPVGGQNFLHGFTASIALFT